MVGHAHAAAADAGSVITGAYRALWNDLDLGLTVDGFNVRETASGRDITADITGETPIDTIFTGVSLQISFTLEYWNAQALEHIAWWFGNSDPAAYEWGLTDGVGMRHWEAARPLILYSCHSEGFSITPDPADPESEAPTTINQSTGASSANPKIDPLDMVFPKTLLSSNSDIDILMSATRPRFIPITLTVYPISNIFNALAWDPTAPDSVERINDCTAIRYFYATRGDASA